MLTEERMQTIIDHAQGHGYDVALALRTAERDGTPWYRTREETFEYQLALHTS